ncbi:hypothetical protein BD309DRAFT_595713 [Dichomitus squalens]|nr:hypothetical protein BD309DRAFT_595713 [Dichomitus squalens]
MLVCYKAHMLSFSLGHGSATSALPCHVSTNYDNSIRTRRYVGHLIGVCLAMSLTFRHSNPSYHVRYTHSPPINIALSCSYGIAQSKSHPGHDVRIAAPERMRQFSRQRAVLGLCGLLISASFL